VSSRLPTRPGDGKRDPQPLCRNAFKSRINNRDGQTRLDVDTCIAGIFMIAPWYGGKPPARDCEQPPERMLAILIKQSAIIGLAAPKER